MNYTEIINTNDLYYVLNKQKYIYFNFNYIAVITLSIIINLILIVFIYLRNYNYKKLEMFKNKREILINLFPPLIIIFLLEHIIKKLFSCCFENNRVHDINVRNERKIINEIEIL